jgi:phage-related protein
LGKVQAGLEPAGWKPFDDVGGGTREIRIQDASCFRKKTQATSKRDKAIAAARYRAVVNARKGTK